MNYKHNLVEDARKALEARKDRSKWNKAVTEDAIGLLDTVNDVCENITRKYSETTEGGHVHTLDMFKSRATLIDAMLNGAKDWSEYSWSGCALIYNSDIAEHYCTPSELKRTRGGEWRPNRNEEWLDVQARALRQAANRAAAALRVAYSKTYTVKEGV